MGATVHRLRHPGMPLTASQLREAEKTVEAANESSKQNCLQAQTIKSLPQSAGLETERTHRCPVEQSVQAEASARTYVDSRSASLLFEQKMMAAANHMMR
ncbi:hypothetical protein KP509_29G075700 [Ceratopteris richardii]|uniref:Uncharacterized protein n=1 Tax=Ceratopteris richardii TaxID=49495 RepID=A0A8T2R9W1_CERRI|nr:hypothetical protein KP509_29G075700 [Ceratopteris richardii]